MKVLITNDDGIRADGLRSLYKALRERGHEVFVVAPMRQQSGVGHSLTFFHPLQASFVKDGDFEGTGVYGTPTDCIKLALGNLLPWTPDLVMSGINAGCNVGPDILYSGTVGAATEACHHEISSMAVSNNEFEHVDVMAKARHAVAMAEAIDWDNVPKRRVININYPKGPLAEAKGVRVCPQTSAVWQNSYEERTDPRGGRYWWILGEVPQDDVNAGTDMALVKSGYITITPLCFSFTDKTGLACLEKMAIPGTPAASQEKK